MKKGGQKWPPFFMPAPYPQTPHIPCGSGLAREGGVSANISAEWETAFASKPAPTGIAFTRPGCGTIPATFSHTRIDHTHERPPHTPPCA
ncbi:hypothetical protein PFAS1_16835 [Pseudomonas frederiksbergensis]|nr:hypothetical protein PFAS1_16835 [Pseudomonas frederiksbergensis]